MDKLKFKYKNIPSRNLKTIFHFMLLKFSFKAGVGKLNVIFATEKIFICGQIALFSIVRLKQGASLKPTLLLNRDLLNYLAGVNKLKNSFFCSIFKFI